MARERAFLENDRQDVAYRPAAERVKDFKSVDIPLTEDEIRVQAARCMDCGTPFCHASASGARWATSSPSSTSSSTTAAGKRRSTSCSRPTASRSSPAGSAPRRARAPACWASSRPPVNICKIELAIIEQGFQRGYVKPEPPSPRRRERVAVIGSGPAGLAAAHVLNRAGFNVTVYEKDSRPGGLLRYGIPDFKLEKWVVDRRVDLMRQEGVVFECGVDVGDDVSDRFLRDRFDAIVLAGGAGVPRDLEVPGRELAGIHFAMDFLTQQNRLVGGEPSTAERAHHGRRARAWW